MNLIKQNCRIILASSSKIRSRIMKDAGIEFETRNPDFDEDSFKDKHPDLSIKDLAIELAKNKALSISDKDSLIIGCDQICEVDGKKLDKSKNENDAIRQLKLMRGKEHSQNNAVVIAQNEKVIFTHFTKVKLMIHNLTDQQIQDYVAQDMPIGCAGSYKYESLGKILFDKAEGDHFSILGMNIQEILSFLFKNNFIKI